MICDESNRPCLCFNVINIIIIYFVDFQMLFLLFYVFPHLFCLLVIQFSACYSVSWKERRHFPEDLTHTLQLPRQESVGLEEERQRLDGNLRR